MKKSLTAILSLILIVVLSASIIAYLNFNLRLPISPLPTSTVTPTLKPSLTPTPTGIYYTYDIANKYPHDTNAFTEGLIYSTGFLYESTGLNGQSSLRKVDLVTGNVLQEYILPGQYFGEGITVVNNTIIQLTWQSHIGFIYEKNTFALLGNFTYPTEGWGLTNNGTQLIMSDGTNQLFFLNPITFQRTGQVGVHDGNQTIVNINELEYIKGDIYANIWLTNKIAIINPENGQVKAWIDLTGIPEPAPNGIGNVLNGIAYDQENNRIFVTGKNWPNLYQINLVPQPTLR
jgi:glutamine cyclotransferase